MGLSDLRFRIKLLSNGPLLDGLPKAATVDAERLSVADGQRFPPGLFIYFWNVDVEKEGHLARLNMSNGRLGRTSSPGLADLAERPLLSWNGLAAKIASPENVLVPHASPTLPPSLLCRTIEAFLVRQGKCCRCNGGERP
jgi:hypothetical protein